MSDKPKNGDSDDGDKANGAANGKPWTNGASHGGASGEDPGAGVVGDVVGVFLADLAKVEGGFVERFRVHTAQAGELLKADGLDLSRPFRIQLRLFRRLMDQFYAVVEVDLPPEETP